MHTLTQAKSPSAHALDNTYEATKWQILIDGKPIQRLVCFELIEKFGHHTQFSLRLYHGQVQEAGTYRIDQGKDLPGKKLTAILGTHLQDDYITFSGIITQVSMVHSNGLNGDIIIRGSSPTILLESGQHRHSFYNKTLEMIAKEVVDHLAGKLEVAIQPRFREKIPYSAQHRESSFTYLARMASWFGEWFYYDGRQLCLGRPTRAPKQTLYYGRHLESLQMDMQVMAVDTIYTSYVSQQDQVLNMYPRQQVAGLSFYGDLALQKAQQLYPQPVKTSPLQWADDMGTLLHVASVNKAALAGNTFLLSGVCRVPSLSIGTRVKVMMGPQDSQVLGEFLITEVSHSLQSGDRYQAHFKAVYGDIEVIPGPILQAPPAETQLAVVRKNDDASGQGRVRVQFHWQQGDNMSDWIRVLSPDGGGTDAVGVNRGMVLVPEVGDQVFVSFLENNPDKPFVSGSAFHGNNSGGQSHMIRTIMTKSGNKVVMNDSEGSITVSDPSGNTWYMDGKGNINVHAPKNMTFTAGENLNINVGQNMTTTVGMAMLYDSKPRQVHSRFCLSLSHFDRYWSRYLDKTI